jgi:hypothetical protein
MILRQPPVTQSSIDIGVAGEIPDPVRTAVDRMLPPQPFVKRVGVPAKLRRCHLSGDLIKAAVLNSRGLLGGA